MRTRLSICARKVRYRSEIEAIAAARQAEVPLRHYRCDRCRQFHLTSRTKGKRIPRPVAGKPIPVGLPRSDGRSGDADVQEAAVSGPSLTVARDRRP